MCLYLRKNKVLNLETGSIESLVQIADKKGVYSSTGNLIWSADGKDVNFSEGIININSGETEWKNHYVRINSIKDTTINGYCLLSPLGNLLACNDRGYNSEGPYNLKIIEVNDFQVIKEVNIENEFGGSFCWAPDNHHIAISMDTTDGSAIYIIDSETGEKMKISEGVGTNGMDFSPDGQWLVVGHLGDKPNVEIVHISDGQSYKLTDGYFGFWQKPLPQVKTNNPPLAGVWQGLVTGQSEGPTQFTEQKIFEIRSDCIDSPICLDVLQASYFHFVSVPPGSNGRNGEACFSIVTPASPTVSSFPFYTACFAMQSDGSLQYQGGHLLGRGRHTATHGCPIRCRTKSSVEFHLPADGKSPVKRWNTSPSNIYRW